LKQAFGIVMGANLGTTVTAQLIAFKVTDFVTVFIALGFVLNILAKGKKLKYSGQIMMGFGIMMLGMQMMGNSVAPLRKYQGFVDFIATFADNPLIGLLAGTVMTCVVQSSTATIGILMAMAGQGLIPLEGAIPVMLGDTMENLKAAADGENEEWADLYPHFADVADAEGFANIAATWRKIAAAEKGHEERYRKLQKRVEEGTVFSREEDTYWQCRECGHIHYGKEALKACPTCAHPQAFFEEMKTNY